MQTELVNLTTLKIPKNLFILSVWLRPRTVVVKVRERERRNIRRSCMVVPGLTECGY